MNNSFTLINDDTEKVISISTFSIVLFCMVFVCVLSFFLFDIQNSLKIIKNRLRIGDQIPYANIHMQTLTTDQQNML